MLNLTDPLWLILALTHRNKAERSEDAHMLEEDTKQTHTYKLKCTETDKDVHKHTIRHSSSSRWQLNITEQQNHEQSKEGNSCILFATVVKC